MEQSFFKIDVKILILLVSFLFFSIPLFSYTQETVDILANEVKVLEEKVDLIEDINVKILNTIYWTLGILASIFVVVIALNFFSNILINRNKLKTIKDDIENLLESKSFAMKEEMNGLIEKNVENFIRKSRQNTTEQLNEINEKIQAFKTEYLKDKKDIIELKMEAYKKNNQIGEFSMAVDLLTLAIRINNQYDIQNSLKIIFNYLKSNRKLDDLLIVRINDLKDELKKLPRDYEVEKEEIERQLRDKTLLNSESF